MRRPRIDIAVRAQLQRAELLLRDVIRSGGTDNWSHLSSHGRSFSTIRSLLRQGYLENIEGSAYRFKITKSGRHSIEQIDFARFTGISE